MAQGATAVPGARQETPYLPLDTALHPKQKAHRPQARMRWRLLSELKHNPQVSGDEEEHLPASGRGGRRGSPPDTGLFSGKVKTKPLKPQGRAGTPPEWKSLHEHRVDQVSCWGGKGSDAEKGPNPVPGARAAPGQGAPIPTINLSPAPSLGVESMGQADPLCPTGEARPCHTPLETPGTSRSLWRNPHPALLLTKLPRSHTNGLMDSISRLVSRHDV